MYRVTAAAHGAKGRDVPKPLRYPRPYERKTKPAAATREEIARMFGRS